MHTFRSQCFELEINYRKKSAKPLAYRLKNILLKNESVNQTAKKLKDIRKQIKMKIQQSKIFEKKFT